jgi:two-component system OmpR family sensor kinase
MDLSRSQNLIKKLLTPLKHLPGYDQAANPAQSSVKVAVAVETGPGQAQLCRVCCAGLAAIIHRLSQPLTALRGSLELGLLTEGSAEDDRLALKESLAQADQLVGLLASLRELVEAEDSSQPAETTSLDQLVIAESAEMRPWAESRGLTLVLKFQSDLYVRANPRWLRHAVSKVIHRAIDRSPESGTVLVTLARSNREARLEVKDNGPAPSPGGLDHLSRASSLGQLFSEASNRGTLEWAIAKRIFEVQGGAARVESEPGQGCCFRASLPLVPSTN